MPYTTNMPRAQLTLLHRIGRTKQQLTQYIVAKELTYFFYIYITVYIERENIIYIYIVQQWPLSLAFREIESRYSSRGN